MKELLVYRFEEIIYAPIEVVFAYVDEDEKIKQWNTMFIENIYDASNNGKTNMQGTTFQTVQKIDNKVLKVDSVIVEYEAPFKIVMHSTSKEGISISKYLLSREYNGTKLVVEASIIPSNFFYEIFTKLFGWASKYIFEEQYRNLKIHIEQDVEN